MRSKAIRLLRNPSWAVIGLFVSAISAGVYVLTRSLYFTQLGILISTILVILTILTANRYVPSISITCLPRKDEMSVKNQHNQEFSFDEFPTEFETYFEIPDWISDFDLTVETVGPIKIGIWEEPDHIITKGNRIIGGKNTEDVELVIRVGGEPENIGNGTYKLIIVDNNSGSELYELSIQSY